MDYTDFKTLNFSVMGNQTKLTGDLEFTGDTILAGEVHGSITMKETGKIVLEQSARIEGEIYCQDIEVFGHFSGTINSSGTLTVRSSAVVSGKINANQLSIYPGAILNMEGSAEANIEHKTQ